MPSFASDGVEIAYSVHGAGDPILLIHGFASSAKVNWIDTGWVSALVRDQRQAIAFDNRGHGGSGKLYDPAVYGAPTMAEDARRLLDHLGIARADVMGYSMGARIAAFLALGHPDRVRRLVLAGLAENMIKGVGGAEEIARALEAESIDQVAEPFARTFRAFADQTRSDRRALAACMRSSRQKITVEALGAIRAPVLVAVGSEDTTAGRAEPLAEAIPGAETLIIPGRDHMKAVGDRVYKQGVLDFLRRHEQPA